MDSDNWVVQNLENALNTWNSKMAEVCRRTGLQHACARGNGQDERPCHEGDGIFIT